MGKVCSLDSRSHTATCADLDRYVIIQKCRTKWYAERDPNCLRFAAPAEAAWKLTGLEVQRLRCQGTLKLSPKAKSRRKGTEENTNFEKAKEWRKGVVENPNPQNPKQGQG